MNTFFWHLQLAALDNLDGLHRLVARALGHILDLVDDIVALKDLSKDDMSPVEPASDDGGDEELRAIGVFAGVGHAEKTGLGVLQLEVFICELVAVNGFPARAVSSSKVPALDHEALDDTMEGRALIAEAFLASR
jgi:hypothetical protein